MARYKTLAEEAADLEAVLAERFPGLSDEDRGQFCAAVLHKVAFLYRQGAKPFRYSEDIALVSRTPDRIETARMPLLINSQEA